MNLLEKLKESFTGKAKPEHLRRGELGERAAKKHLQKPASNFSRPISVPHAARLI